MTPRKLRPEEVTEEGFYWAKFNGKGWRDQIVRVDERALSMSRFFIRVPGDSKMYEMSQVVDLYGPIPSPFEKKEDSK